MDDRRVYPTVLMNAFEDMLADGATVMFIVADRPDSKHGYVYHVVITTKDNKEFLLARNRGQETFIYDIKSSISIAGFTRKKKIKKYCAESPDEEKYPTFQ